MSRSEHSGMEPPTRDPSPEEKLAFVKAVSRGIPPGADGRNSSCAGGDELRLLRKISPEPAAASGLDGTDDRLSARALALSDLINALTESGGASHLPLPAMQALLGALCRSIAARAEADSDFDVLGPKTGATATDVMVMCGRLLQSADLQVFELAMWQSWSGC